MVNSDFVTDHTVLACQVHRISGVLSACMEVLSPPPLTPRAGALPLPCDPLKLGDLRHITGESCVLPDHLQALWVNQKGLCSLLTTIQLLYPFSNILSL